MAAMQATGVSRMRSLLHSQQFVRLLRTTSPAVDFDGAAAAIRRGGVRCASTKSRGGDKKSSRLVEVQRLLYQAEERYKAGGGVGPIPRITLDHVSISYANTGGVGGQNFKKALNTKVDMRFNVKNAHWLDERVRERIMQMEKNRINHAGEIVISSKKSRAQKSKADDAVAKLQVFAYQKKKLQAIVDAASYVPLPLSKETAKKISELSTLAEQKRMEGKKKSQLQKKVL